MPRGSKPCPEGCTCRKHSTPGRITPQCREAARAVSGRPRGPYSAEHRQRIAEGVRRAWAQPDSTFRTAFTPEVVARRNASIREAYAGSRARAKRELRERETACGVCGVEESLVVDHNHACCEYGCGACLRGVLCSRCNVAIGMLDDDPERCESAAVYLRERA